MDPTPHTNPLPQAANDDVEMPELACEGCSGSGEVVIARAWVRDADAGTLEEAVTDACPYCRPVIAPAAAAMPAPVERALSDDDLPF